MPEYVVKSLLSKDGEAYHVGSTIELTKEQADNLGWKVKPVSEADDSEVNEQSLEDKTVAELRDIAKSEGIDGVSNMNKQQLIEAIESTE